MAKTEIISLEQRKPIADAFDLCNYFDINW
jgi:hypothetical protein